LLLRRSSNQQVKDEYNWRRCRNRNRFFNMARASALECASIQDCLEVSEGVIADQNAY